MNPPFIAFVNALPAGNSHQHVHFSSCKTVTRSTNTICHQRRCTCAKRNEYAPRACASPAPSSSIEFEFFPRDSLPERLFDGYKHPIIRGAAGLAVKRGVPLDDLSASYGHILASTVREELPSHALNNEILTGTLRDALSTATMTTNQVDLTTLSRLMTEATTTKNKTTATEKTKNEEEEQKKVSQLSKLYAQMLASSIQLSALEFSTAPLCATFETCLQTGTNSVAFPMSSREAYDEAFAQLQECAATVRGATLLDAADKFFTSLKSHECVIDVDGDGYILMIRHSTKNNNNKEIGEEDTEASFALRARLLDGRCVMSALPSQLEEEGPLTVRIGDLPLAMAKALAKTKDGESVTVFYHPYAAHEVIPLFLEQDQIPMQAGLVLDVRLLELH